jgi:hypothetical protein
MALKEMLSIGMNKWPGAFIDRSECYSSAAPGLQTIEGINEQYQGTIG